MNLFFSSLRSIFVLLIVLSCCAHNSIAKVVCENVEFGREDYDKGMKKLASEARLPGRDYNRYHEILVHDLCSNNPDGAVSLVKEGFVPSEDAMRIAFELQKNVTFAGETYTGKRYQYVKKRLIDLGSCQACADNITQYYLKFPKSRCALEAQRALSGDNSAIGMILDFPKYCRWKY